MGLKEYNNKKVMLKTIEGNIFEGLAMFNDKDDYDEEEDALSIKQKIGWVMIFESEVKEIKLAVI